MRPIILTIEEVKTELIDKVNSAIDQGVPCYFLESILADILAQVKNGSKMELEQAKAMELEQAKAKEKETSTDTTE